MRRTARKSWMQVHRTNCKGGFSCVSVDCTIRIAAHAQTISCVSTATSGTASRGLTVGEVCMYRNILCHIRRASFASQMSFLTPVELTR